MRLGAKPSDHVSPRFDFAKDTHLRGRQILGGLGRMSLAVVNDELPRIAKGYGELAIEMVSGQSAATSVCSSSPLKILVPRPRGESVWAYLSSFGGGLVAGDETNITVNLAAQTRCYLSTQASTKVYRNPDNRPCSHQLRATVGEGAVLVLAPDPVQAFAGSSYLQRQEFRLAGGSGLVLVDWFGSGRAACGERWEFDRFQSRNDFFIDGKRVLVDALSLDSNEGSLMSAHRMGRANCLAIVLIMGEALRAQGAEVLKEIAARPVTRRATLLCSASAVKEGVLLRFAGEQVEEVGREIHRLLAFLPGLLQDDPWARKW
jgi:urease accessory protein